LDLVKLVKFSYTTSPTGHNILPAFIYLITNYNLHYLVTFLPNYF